MDVHVVSGDKNNKIRLIPRRCEQCHEVFQSSKVLRSHLAKSNHAKYRCGECDKVFIFKGTLKQHQRCTGHKQKEEEKEEKIEKKKSVAPRNWEKEIGQRL